MTGGTIGWKGPALVASVALVFSAVAAQTDGAQCIDCHDTDAEAFATSVHGPLECADCHTAAAEFPHGEDAASADCATCHDTEVREYLESIHGVDRARGLAEAPDCQSCHGPIHALVPRSEAASPLHPTRLPATCGSCHSNPEVVRKFRIPVVKPLEAFRGSVHARMVSEDRGGPTCSDCHGSHALFGAGDPRSMVFHTRVPDTCGRCHEQIAEAFSNSVHGRAAQHGIREAPVCTDCHGEHRILSPSERGSPVFATNIPKLTCGRCHGDLRLAEKYGMPSEQVRAYADSYHGLAARAGTVTVAHCGSCHGVHDILPSTDPASHTHPDNLRATCGKCHPGAGTRFAIGTVHVLPKSPTHAAVYWARIAYLWLIYLTVGGMLLHNLLDLRRKFLDPPARPSGPPPTAEERMGRGFRIAHLLLIVSFGVLVYTGFALKYPEAWWARPLLQWEATLGLRGWLHRAAAVAMLIALGFHFVHLAVDRRARACIAGMRPRLEDLHEFRERLAWYLGRRKQPPAAPSLGYPEKVEYLALMWGLAVMSLTGFALWAENLVLRWFPKWVTDLATTIHFYEAVLATLAILLWHFYFVIFDPVVYPMDTAWLTGRSAAGRVHERRHEPAAGAAAGPVRLPAADARKMSPKRPATRGSPRRS